MGEGAYINTIPISAYAHLMLQNVRASDWQVLVTKCSEPLLNFSENWI